MTITRSPQKRLGRSNAAVTATSEPVPTLPAGIGAIGSTDVAVVRQA